MVIWFHLNSGLQFGRENDKILIKLDDKTITTDNNGFASVIAFLTSKGDTSEQWNKARELLNS